MRSVSCDLYVEKDGRFYRPDGSEIPFTKFPPGVHLGWLPSWMRYASLDSAGRPAAHVRGEGGRVMPGCIWFQPCGSVDR